MWSGVLRFQTATAHPLGVGDGLTRALRVGEARDDGRAVDHQAAVRGVDHVGQACDGLDHLDGVPEAAVRRQQVLPLPDREGGVDGVDVSIHGLIAYSTVKNVGAVMA